MFWGRKSKRSVRAAEWVGRLHTGELSEDKLQEFHEWLADPRNAREFKSQQTVLGAVADLSPGHKADLVRCVQPDWRRSSAGWNWLRADLRVPRPVLLASAVSVALAVAVTAGWVRLRETGILPDTYATAVGESRTVVFPDGSVAYLNTQTELQWIGSAGHDRRVRLKMGEALFEVVHDQSRPFLIYLDHSVIRVLGTKFDVYRKSNGNVVVTVLTGTVAVEGVEDGGAEPLWQRQLVADQQLEYGSNGLIAADVHSTPAAKVVRWRDGELETSGEALLNVVSELNRYTRKPIVIADPRVGTAPIGGTFSIYDIDSTLRRIQLIAPISITRTDSGFVLNYQPGVRPLTRPSAPVMKSSPASEGSRS